jgi:hypothetical protein
MDCLRAAPLVTIALSIGCATPPATSEPPLCEAPCELVTHFDGKIEGLTFSAGRVVARVFAGSGHEALEMVPADGGTATRILTFPERYVAPGAIASAGNDVFFTGGSDRRFVQQIRVGGGLPTTLEHGSELFSVATDGSWLVASGARGLLVITLDGSEAPKLDGGESSDVAGLDGQNVYTYTLFSSFGSGSLVASPRDGGLPQTLVETGGIAGVALDSTHAYITEGAEDDGGRLTGKVTKVPLVGGPSRTLVQIDDLPNNLESTVGCAVDKAFVYFPAAGFVGAVSIEGGTLERFVDGVDALVLAADAAHVYFNLRTDPATLLRAPKRAP